MFHGSSEPDYTHTHTGNTFLTTGILVDTTLGKYSIEQNFTISTFPKIFTAYILHALLSLSSLLFAVVVAWVKNRPLKKQSRSKMILVSPLYFLPISVSEIDLFFLSLCLKPAFSFYLCVWNLPFLCIPVFEIFLSSSTKHVELNVNPIHDRIGALKIDKKKQKTKKKPLSKQKEKKKKRKTNRARVRCSEHSQISWTITALWCELK